MALFKQKIKPLEAPVLFVAGNHDVGIVGVGDVKTSITPETRLLQSGLCLKINAAGMLGFSCT
jgi:hypothetical protein